MNTCTNTDCGRGSELFLCTHCIVELDELLQDVPFLYKNLDPVLQATKVTRRAGGQGGNGTGGGASKPPMDLDAGLTRQWLAWLPVRAYTEAEENPEAGRTLYMARIWVHNARRLVWGHEPEKVDIADVRKRVADIAPAMPTRQLISWLRENAGITLKRADINNWRMRGKLRPVEREPMPTYLPHEVLNLWHEKQLS